MVSRWTWIILFKWIFILARNYNGFMVDMDSLVQVNVQFSEELQYFCGGHVFFIRPSHSFACVYPARCIHYASWIFAESAPFSYTYARCEVTRRPWDRQIGVKSASSPPRPKSAPRGSKSTTFAKGIFQLFNLRKIASNPMGDPSVFSHSISDILIRRSWSLRSFRNWRLVCCQ